MNTSVISSTYAYSGVQSNVAGSQSPTKPHDSGETRSNDGAHRLRGGGEEGVVGAVFQALGRLGLNIPAPSSAKPATSQSSSTSQPGAAGATSASGGGDVKQALHSFMHDVLQAARATDASGKTSLSASATGRRYGELAGKLDSLAQQLNSGGGSDALNSLKSSFNNLVKSLDNGSTSGKAATAGKAPDLQDFLHEVSRNLQGGSQNLVGSLVSTAA